MLKVLGIDSELGAVTERRIPRAGIQQQPSTIGTVHYQRGMRPMNAVSGSRAQEGYLDLRQN